MVRGRYFDSRRSAAVDATLQLQADGQWLLMAGDVRVSLDPQLVQVSDRIGSIPRRLALVDGAEFETTDNDGMDALLGEHIRPHSRFVHALERNWGVALASLAGVVLVSILMVKYGLPAMAGWAAARLPPETDRLIGAQTLQVLDRSVMDASQLHPQRQAQLANLFTRMTATLADGHEYRIEFRHSPRLGPNALALPSGIVVVTDELVGLAKNDEEIEAVLAHEIGHVQGRHALRQLIQGAGISILALVVLGDVSSVSALGSAAPVLLQAKNSRDFEREADAYARSWMQQAGVPGSRFDDILCRMTQTRGANGKNQDSEVPVFLSTHPSTAERASCKSE